MSAVGVLYDPYSDDTQLIGLLSCSNPHGDKTGRFCVGPADFLSKTPADFLGRKIGRDHSSKLPADFAAKTAPNNQAKNSVDFLAKKRPKK